jgi:hypothetical protein
MANDRVDDEPTRKSFKVVDNRRFDGEGKERSDVGLIKGGPEIKSEVKASKPIEPVVASKPPSAVTEKPKAAEVEIQNAESYLGADEGSEYSDFDFAGREGAQEADESGLDFSSFIMSFATQALMQLGLARSEDGIELPVDKVAAMQTIDIIAMLEAKTRGNLTASEAQLVEQVLHELRLAFVKVPK